MATIQSTDLDFDAIKSSLKTYLQRSTEFQDYDFEASGLSNILDVLAYNTHINGLIANVGINESFLNSAQLRASVVAHAETLGYRPRSRTASVVNLNLSLATANAALPLATLPKNSTFTTSIDGQSYTFQTLEEYTASNDGAGNFSFVTSAGSTSIPAYEGTVKTKTFIIGDTADDQVYVIPDVTIDTSTVNVKVYETVTSSSFVSYVDIEDTVRINAESKVYIIRETPNGFYEISFGEGNVLGLAPQAGNKIVIEYISSIGAAANGGTTFVADQDITVSGTDYPLTITTVSNSASGAEKESINSIKANAPISFATQQRLVTAEDYKALILSRYSSTVQDATAWGGNDNVPPVYGRVYVSLKFIEGLTSDNQTVIKNSIQSQLSANLGIMSIDTVFEDPIDTFLELTTRFNFDPDLSGITVEAQQVNIQNTINNYFSANLSTFDAVFRRSTLLATIDALSPAILNSTMTVKIQQRFTPTLNSALNYNINFPVVLSSPSSTEYIITTSVFTLATGETVFGRNRLNSTILELVDTTSGSVIVDNAGSYAQSTGVVSFVGVNISSHVGDSVKVTSTPGNQSTIRPLRNYIITIDSNRSTSIGVLDYQNTATTL